MANFLISGKTSEFRTTVAKNIVKSIPKKNKINVYTNDDTQYVDEEGFNVIEFGCDSIYESHDIKIENGSVLLIDEYSSFA